MKLTYYGHAGFAVQINHRTLLFDPFITPNELAKNINVDDVPADCILISHGHRDHLADAAGIARRTGAILVANFEIATWFDKQGLSKTHPLNLGGSFRFDSIRVKFGNAIHSSLLPDGSPGGRQAAASAGTRRIAQFLRPGAVPGAKIEPAMRYPRIPFGLLSGSLAYRSGGPGGTNRDSRNT